MRAFAEALSRAGDCPAIGTFIKIANPNVADLLRAADLDFVIVDYEHSPFSVGEVAAMVAAFAGTGVPALVRVGDHSYADSQRLLDAGAAGIVVPHVTDAATAREVMSHLLVPPRGTRGLGYTSRAGGWGMLDGGMAEYIRHGNEVVARIPMIEDPSAVEEIDDILAVDGVSAVFVGRGDLSVAMGVTSAHPAVDAALDRVAAAARRRGVPCGTAVADAAGAHALRGRGMDFLLVSNDASMLAAGAAALAGGARAGYGSPADPLATGGKK